MEDAPLERGAPRVESPLPIITLSYYVIPFAALIHFVRRRADLAFRWGRG